MATNVIPDTEKISNENQSTVKTLSVKLVKNSKKHMHVMQFNEAQQVQFSDWKRVRLHREDNSSLHTRNILDEPKFGGGSTFGRLAREEARQRRFARYKYKPENQPWILTTNSTDGNKLAKNKTFKGTREGGVGDNSTYYIFVTNSDGKSLSAYPIQDWYKFRSIQRYNTLSVDEAEEEYMRRDKRLNYFSVMTQKRLRDENENEDIKNQGDTLKKSVKDLKISEMDDWISSGEDGDCDSDADNKQSDNDKDKKKKKKAYLKKKNVSDNEAFEESDDGDEEGRECEYITDSSASESELEQQKEEGSKSVAEEIGLQNLFGSDSKSHSDEAEAKSSDKDDDNTKKDKKTSDKEKPARGADKSVNRRGSEKENKSVTDNLLNVAENKIVEEDEKVKIQKRTKIVSLDEVQAKRYKRDSASALSESSYIFKASESGISIEAVSRYLKRKPMTLVDLLKKFKSKKTGLSKEEVGHILILTLKKMKLNKQKINGVTYYSL